MGFSGRFGLRSLTVVGFDLGGGEVVEFAVADVADKFAWMRSSLNHDTHPQVAISRSSRPRQGPPFAVGAAGLRHSSVLNSPMALPSSGNSDTIKRHNPCLAEGRCPEHLLRQGTGPPGPDAHHHDHRTHRPTSTSVRAIPQVELETTYRADQEDLTAPVARPLPGRTLSRRGRPPPVVNPGVGVVGGGLLVAWGSVGCVRLPCRSGGVVASVAGRPVW